MWKMVTQRSPEQTFITLLIKCIIFHIYYISAERLRIKREQRLFWGQTHLLQKFS